MTDKIKRGVWKELHGRAAVLAFLGRAREGAAKAHKTAVGAVSVSNSPGTIRQVDYWTHATACIDWLINLASREGHGRGGHDPADQL